MRLETLPNSTLLDELRQHGYDVTATGEGERIIPSAIAQKFVVGLDGELEPLTSGSTRAVALTVTHAGIVKVERWAFSF